MMAFAQPPAQSESDEWAAETWITIALGGSLTFIVATGILYMAWRRYRGRLGVGRVSIRRTSRSTQKRGSSPATAQLEQEPGKTLEAVDAPGAPLLALS